MTSSCTMYSTVKKRVISHKLAESIVLFVLQKERTKGNMSVHFIGDTRMRRLNHVFRGKDKTTDVLSFAMEEGEDMPFVTGERELGDIFISVPQILRQAKRFEVTQKEEMIRMLVHGVLHILGYDHETEKEAAVMFPKQEKYVATWMKK